MDDNQLDPIGEHRKSTKKSRYSLVSLILALVPTIYLLAVLLLLIIATSNTIFAGAWPYFIILIAIYVVIAFISSILSVIFGIIGLIKNNNKTLFSWVGIIIVSFRVLIYLLL